MRLWLDFSSKTRNCTLLGKSFGKANCPSSHLQSSPWLREPWTSTKKWVALWHNRLNLLLGDSALRTTTIVQCGHTESDIGNAIIMYAVWEICYVQWLPDLLLYSRWRSCSTTTICNHKSGLQMVVAEQLRHLLYTSRSSNHWLCETCLKQYTEYCISC